jgi:hypothetical protein
MVLSLYNFSAQSTPLTPVLSIRIILLSFSHKKSIHINWRSIMKIKLMEKSHYMPIKMSAPYINIYPKPKRIIVFSNMI